MNVITEDLGEKTPWTMLFADGVVISDENTEDLERRFETWRKKLEKVALKLIRKKTDQLPSVGRQESILLREYNMAANLPP